MVTGLEHLEAEQLVKVKRNGPLTTAVLLVIFNRADTTRQVFEAIRKAKPPRLYIAADGPRPNHPTDAVRCAETRKVVANIDWDCQVKTRFMDENLNCGRGPSSAFSWFFEHEEEGIILEDDCLPSESFFYFCQELLKKYRHDTRIMHIGGNNHLEGWKKDKDYSYYFSRSGHIWGWATWRRAWNKFQFDIAPLYYKLRDRGQFDHYFSNYFETRYRMGKLEETAAKGGRQDWWDYQWDFARYVNSGLSIVPNTNLVKNIGFGEDATHTPDNKIAAAALNANEIDFPLHDPPFMMRDVESEKRYFRVLLKDKVLSKLRKMGLPV